MKYLLAVDGSEHAENAAQFVRAMARPKDEVILYSAAKIQYIDASIVDKARDMLSAAGKELMLTSRTETKRDAREGIKECAAKEAVDIVVLGSRGLGVVKRALLGSVSTDVVHSVTCAVLVVHHPPLDGVQTYMLCADGSEACEKATELLAKLLNKEDHVVIYTGFVPPPLMIATGRVVMRNPEYEQDLQEAQQRALACIDETKRILLTQSVLPAEHITAKVEASNEPRDAAIEFADLNHLKTIVCGSRGLGTVRRMVFGSFSSHILHNATQHAVLIVH